jgi:hypothetical protein
MQVELLRSLIAPLHYWRTILLVMFVGVLVSNLFGDALVLLLSTLVSAFVFSAYEHRRWIVMPADLRAGDFVVRLGLALAATYVFSSARVGLISNDAFDAMLGWLK